MRTSSGQRCGRVHTHTQTGVNDARLTASQQRPVAAAHTHRLNASAAGATTVETVPVCGRYSSGNREQRPLELAPCAIIVHRAYTAHGARAG